MDETRIHRAEALHTQQQSPGQRQTAAHLTGALRRTCSGRSGGRVCTVHQTNLIFDIDLLATVELFGSS